MTINFEHYGKFFISFTYDDNTIDYYEADGEGYSLKEAADWISENMENSLSIVSADIIDAETGEIVATIEKDEEDFIEDYEPPYTWIEKDYDEMGFNPYIGCYDFDC